MIGTWEIAQFSEPHRYALYARAYLETSIASCRRMIQDESSRKWPNAAVVMLLAAHSVELFLKGAILARDPTAELGNHRLSDLNEKYKALYAEPELHFESPFQTEYLGFDAAEIGALKKNEPTPSVLFRYPIKKPGTEWRGIHAFEPQSFIQVLTYLDESYDRIGKSI